MRGCICRRHCNIDTTRSSATQAMRGNAAHGAFQKTIPADRVSGGVSISDTADLFRARLGNVLENKHQPWLLRKRLP